METNNAIEVAFLNAAEIHKWIMFGSVQLDERLFFPRNCSRNVTAIGKKSVGEVHTVRAGWRKAFLV